MTNSALQKALDGIAKGKKMLEGKAPCREKFFLDLVKETAALRQRDPHLEALLLIGRFYVMKEASYQKALKIAAQGIAICPERKKEYKADFYKLQGNAANALSDSQTTTAAYLKGIAILEKLEDQSKSVLQKRASLYYSLGSLYKEEGHEQEKVQLLKQALSLYKKTGNTSGMAMCYNGFAIHYGTIKQFEKSHQYLLKCLVAYEKLHDERAIAGLLGNLALVLLNMNRVKDAKPYLDRAFKMRQRLGNKHLLATIHYVYGHYYMAVKKNALAITSFSTAIKLGEQLGLKYEISSFLMGIYTACKAAGRYKEAMEYHERYLALKEELYNMEKTVALERIMLESEASREKMKGRLLKIKNNEVQRYAKKLEQSNSDLRQFAQIASHDLKEPLRTMHMYMTLLERRLGNADEEMSEYFGYVKSSSERLYNLVSDLMVFTKMESEPRRTNVIEMNEVMKDAMANLGALIERSGAKIVYGSLPSVKGTRFELVQLLQNLISNGIKYNQSKEPLINIKSKVRTNEVEFCISDNGIGIEESYWKKVFQIFQRLHYSEQHPGTGIGLAICKKIVENHGGKIWIKSEPGVGSRFYFILPKS